VPAGFKGVTVPFRTARGYPPLVAVKLADGVERLFVIDTGSDEAVLTSEAAKSLGLPTKGKTTIRDNKGQEHPTPAWVILDTLTLGDLTVARVPARVPPGLRYPIESIAGSLGRDFLRRFRPVLDYPARTLTLSRPDGPALDGVPFDLLGAILLEGFNGDHDLGKFALDTSSYTPGALDFDLVGRETGLTLFDKGVRVIPEGPYLFKFTMPSLRVADVEFRNFAATAVDLRSLSGQMGVRIRGIVGNSLLRGCRLEIDFRNQRLSLKRVAETPPPEASPGA
jgi:hypothetical protein